MFENAWTHLVKIHATRHFIQYHIHLYLGRIEQGIGLIEGEVLELNVSRHFIFYHIHLRLCQMELGIGLMELGIGLEIVNARCTVLVRVV